MMESYKLSRKLRRYVEKEIESSEVVQWIEQPIPRFFTRSTLGLCLTLLISLSFFSFIGLGVYEQARNSGRPVYDFPEVMGILIPLVGAVVQLILVFLIPFLSWLEAIQTVYVITSKRTFILTVGWSTTITSFISSELRVIVRRENKDGSGDVIIYIHQSKDYDGDIQTKEIGFKQVHNLKAFENMLRRTNFS
jgi:hypothetical protein